MCDICKMDTCPPPCPNYIPSQASYYCCDCGEGIYEGEEYIVNEDGECRHYDCFYTIRDLAEWLGYKIKTMR